MTCGSCRSVARKAVTRSSNGTAAASWLRNTTRSTRSNTISTIANRTAASSPSPSRATRYLSTSSPRPIFGLRGSHEGAYNVIGATELLFKACAKKADYSISKEARKDDSVDKLEDGEELGVPHDKNNEWHNFFQLSPTFSCWSHVTMLHLYLLNARIRCFDRDAYRNWQHQLVDHFFFECEKKMHVDHNITTSALRQRYLKDVFVQWRGLIIAYDEGVYRSDAILASAVWRNLYKGDPDVDPRCLAAVVGYMRATLRALEDTSDQNFAMMASEIIEKPVSPFWKRLEKPFREGPGGADTAEGKTAITDAPAGEMETPSSTVT